MTDVQDSLVTVLALNPAVDISYEIPQLIEYQKVCASNTWHHPGGNGINVTRALAMLSVPVHCCSVTGGESGEMLLRLLGDDIGEQYTWFHIHGETRVNTTLLQKNPPGQYEITSSGPNVPPDVLERISSCFVESAGGGIAVLTGQLPSGVPDSLYRDLAERVSGQGGSVVVDAHGPELKYALEAAPCLVRLNQYVLEMYMKRRLEDLQQVADAARMIQQRGINFLCVSLGQDGAILANADDTWHCEAPKVHKQSTVGCGDALVAGLIAELRRGGTPEEMLRFGVICGSATASKPGTGLFERDEVDTASLDLKISSLGI